VAAAVKILRLRCQCGRNLADVPPYPGGYAALHVQARPGVTYRRWAPAPYEVTHSWDCPDCGQTPTLRAATIDAAYRAHAGDTPRVVRLTIGLDL
jgi:hypothetical protein